MHLLFDVGGTKLRLALSKNLRTFYGAPKIYKTPKTFEKGLKIFEEFAGRYKKEIKYVAGGLAGALDPRRKQLVHGSNIKGWLYKPIYNKLGAMFHCPVFLENDAALAGLGEVRFGAGKGSPILVYVTVSTGLGGTRIVGGKIDGGIFTAEPGCQVVDAGGAMCRRCNGKHLGAHISGRALQDHFKKEPREIKDKKLQDSLAKWLAYGLNNSIVHWSPDTIVLGGSVMNIIPIARVRFHLGKIFSAYPKLPTIKRALLGDFGGLYGAMALISQKK